MKRGMVVALGLTVILACYASYGWAAAPRTGLVAEYLFQGNAKDTSGNNNHGEVFGAVLVEDRFDRAKSAYYFNGKSSYIRVPHSASLNLKDSLTFSVWVYISSFNPNGYAMILDKGPNTLTYEFFVQRTEMVVALGKKPVDVELREGPLDIRLDQWNHLALTWDGTNVTYYFNGVPDRDVDTFEGPLNTNAEALFIGRSPIGRVISPEFDEYFHGAIDDIRIYDRALTAAQIIAVYNDKKPVIIDFKVDQDAGKSPLDVNFKCRATSSNASIKKYEWDVDGDGVTDFETDVGALSHTYNSNGTYRPRVRVIDGRNYTAYSQYLNVKVGEGPELAGRVEYFQFDDNAKSVDIEVRIFNWGDAAAGPFDVVFSVSDNRLASTIIKTVSVDAGLAAGQDTLVTVSRTFASSQYGRLFLVEIDSGNKVDEVKETNNDLELFVGSTSN